MRCIYCEAPTREIGRTIYQIRHYCPVCRHTFPTDQELAPEQSNNSFMCYNHQGKANLLVEALAPKWEMYDGEGWRIKAKFMLSDSDVKGRVSQLERTRRVGCRAFFVYPHTARPSMINDKYPTWEHTTAQFVVNEHHAEVLRGYGYKKPLESIGWTLCPLREFQPRRRVKHVLFAPVHPRNAPIDRQVNLLTFEKLHKLSRQGAFRLTVRHVGDLVDNGLPARAEGVTYIQGRMNQDFSDIDSADVLVGHQTVAWIAVARGVPTLMMAEDMPTHFRQGNQSYEDVPSWNKVKRLFQYPLDILEEDDTMSLLERAARSDDEIADWRRRLIGETFDPQKFRTVVESYL